MNLDLADRLRKRLEDGNPVKIGIIGLGKFATMFLSQARLIKGFQITALADLDYKRANDALMTAGYDPNITVNNIDKAIQESKIYITENGLEVAGAEQLDVIVEATGNPEAGVDHTLAAFNVKSHVVLVTVEADVLCGGSLVKRAIDAGVVYTMAYGDQPSLICELVERIRSSGFEITCAGKGTQYLPVYHSSTPETVWDYYGLSSQEAAAGGLNPKMFNSFLDGTKSAIEMAAVANATGLSVPRDGLKFPPVGTSGLAQVLKPKIKGGVIKKEGTVEVVSSLERDGKEIADHLRFGVYVVFKASTEYVSRCFSEYGIPTDDEGNYAALWRPVHLIGLELGFSVGKAVLDKQAVGATKNFVGDVVSVAKKDLMPGDMLDGEGGRTVWGRLMPAENSISINALPIGLAHKVKLIKKVKKGEVISQNDVTSPIDSNALVLRKEMENDFIKGKNL